MTTGKTSQESKLPRAIIHKRILEVAKARPDATIEEIARDVSGATVGLVDRVLDEYGDPGEEPVTPVSPKKPNGSQPQADGPGGAHPEEQDEKRSKTTVEDLSETQYETLQLIYEHPTASQREIAAMLDIAHTTVYHRLQPIEDFSWKERWEYVTNLFEDESRETAVEQLVELNGHHTTPSATDSGTDCSTFNDTKLTQKVIHAVIDADDITDEEVHLIVDKLLQ